MGAGTALLAVGFGPEAACGAAAGAEKAPANGSALCCAAACVLGAGALSCANGSEACGRSITVSPMCDIEGFHPWLTLQHHRTLLDYFLREVVVWLPTPGLQVSIHGNASTICLMVQGSERHTAAWPGLAAGAAGPAGWPKGSLEAAALSAPLLLAPKPDIQSSPVAGLALSPPAKASQSF